MQAIQTKFLGPTNHRGARVKAYAQAGSITVSWDYALGIDDNHAAAAKALAAKFGWSGFLVQGHLADGSRVFVFSETGPEQKYEAPRILCPDPNYEPTDAQMGYEGDGVFADNH